MFSYFVAPKQFQLLETTSEFMKGCVTGYCLGKGPLAVGTACGLTRFISAVANRYFQMHYANIITSLTILSETCKSDN